MKDAKSQSPGMRPDVAGLRAVVRMAKALEEAASELERIEAEYGLSEDQRKTFRDQLPRYMRQRPENELAKSKPLPARAPEFWSDRQGRKENPVAFIQRVYGPWLGHGLKRGDIRALDKPLYQALAVWMHRHPETNFDELDPEGESDRHVTAPGKRSWAEDMIKSGRRLARQRGDK